MTTLSELVELNVEQLSNKLDAAMPYTVIADVKHYKTVYNSIEKGKNYKLLIFICDNETLTKEHLTDAYNAFLLAAEDKETALKYANEAKMLSSRIYVVR
ncbi:MAG TPA: hypothetical protein DIU39_03515 [Flavobacteriales bacterium]|nr:hypothetical protein [Flavobacteriales bacterium]|tara:strand:- start:57047 stop:57346 length:300 start_codon:yes stop_codon:yes gene_type:complete